MSELDVRIVRLDRMRVVSAYGFGTNPEEQAWEKLSTWAVPRGLIGDPGTFRTFGFNNPDPSPGSPNYGYEIWLPVGEDVEPGGDLRVKDFEGGLYAVTRFTDLNRIGEVWKQLVVWREGSRYQPAHHQWLEELLVDTNSPLEEYEFDLYLPIAE